MKNTKRSIGIVGAGQLCKMLVEAAKRLKLKTVVFAKSSEEPGALLADDVVIDRGDEKSRRSFLEKVSAVTYENEFLDIESWRVLDTDCFVPPLSRMEFFQEKINQKRRFETLRIPTAEFLVYEEGNFQEWIAKATKQLGEEFVLKWSRYGYDGHGTLVVNSEVSAKDLDAFYRKALEKRVRLFAEKKVHFKRELAMIGLRGDQGNFSNYPLVVSKQVNNICSEVYGPATAFGFPKAIEEKARSYLERFAEDNSWVGVFAFEFFIDQNDELLVNELAPRVHNSGHYTMDACETDQFENHIRAVAGLALGSCELNFQAFGMKNLLSPQTGELREAPRTFSMPEESGVYFHWYNKSVLRPGRKMGHLNLIANSAQELEKLMKKVCEEEAKWWNFLIKKEAL